MSLWLLEPMVAMSITIRYIQLATQCSYHTTRTLTMSAHSYLVVWQFIGLLCILFWYTRQVIMECQTT